jgi:hypothetical protein
MSPHPAPTDPSGALDDAEQQAAAVAERERLETQHRLSVPLLFIGARCLARYVVLPFVLPLLATALVGAWGGLISGGVLAILLFLDIAGVISIAGIVRHLFRRRRPHRRKYLLVAVALTAIIVVFFISDTRVLEFTH